MRILGESVKARYLDSIGLNGDFPDDGYQGNYIYEIANDLIKEHKKTLCDRNTIFKKTAEEYIFRNRKGLCVQVCANSTRDVSDPSFC